MTEPIDHATKAVALLKPLDKRYTDFDRVQFIAQAQVHATLALAQAVRESAVDSFTLADRLQSAIENGLAAADTWAGRTR